MSWLLGGALEVLFWVGLGVALLARYWWRRPQLARWALGWLVLDTAGFAALGAVDLVRTGRFSTFQVVAVGAVVYALTVGRKEVRRFDHRAAQLVDAYRAGLAAGETGSARGLVAFAVRRRAGRQWAAGPADPTAAAGAGGAGGAGGTAAVGSATAADGAHLAATGGADRPAGDATRDWEHARRERRLWRRHLVVFVPGQAVLWSVVGMAGGRSQAREVFVLACGWAVAFAVDTIWSLSYSILPRRVR